MYRHRPVCADAACGVALRPRWSGRVGLGNRAGEKSGGVDKREKGASGLKEGKCGWARSVGKTGGKVEGKIERRERMLRWMAKEERRRVRVIILR